MECPLCGAQTAGESSKCSACGRDLADFNETMERGSDEEPTQLDSRAARFSGSRPSWPGAERLQPGTNLGHRYVIVRQLGEGGMGEVYLAEDRELDRRVALKIIRGDLARNQTTIERFRREIQLSSRITHRNVLRVYDVGEADGLKFLTMEYVEGETLSSMLRREGRLPLDRALGIFRQLCEGLLVAHQEGVIHRDLKPQNVMIDATGRVAIADFGLAKSIQQTTLTEHGKVIGTPHYMSPEQVKGTALDQRSDIYSLGIILYEMLTGTIPFSGTSVYEVMIQRVTAKPRAASDHNPQIPRYLQTIVHRCLEPDPNIRYASVAEILRDLDAQSARRPLAAAMRRRWVRPAAAAVVAIAILVGGGFAFRAFRASRERVAEASHKPVSVLVADLQNRTGDPVFDGTLEPVLNLALEGASFINSYNRASARKSAAQIQPNATGLDASLARLVAVREGISAVVSGALSKSGSDYRLDLTAVDPVSGKPIGSSEVTAAAKDKILGAVGRAAADIRTALGDTTPVAAQMAAAETFTAGSLEAAHEYATGQDLYYAGKFDDAAKHYEQAVKLDPNLGRAYAGLGAVYANLGRKSDSEAYYKLAMAHLDRMSDREKYRTRATYYLVMRENARAIEELNQLIRLYPVDMAGLNNLALAYFYNRDMTKAMALSQRPIELYPKNAIARSNAALYAMYAGEFATATKLAQGVLATSPTYTSPYVAIALSQLGEGNTEAAAATYQKLSGVSTRGASIASQGLADIAMYEGRMHDAIATLKEGIEKDRTAKNADAANRKLGTLAVAQLAAGDTAGAIASASEVAKSGSHDQHALYTAAHVLVEAGQYEPALTIANGLESRIEPELQLYGKLIEGEVLLRKGNAREALTKFDDADKLSDAWLARFDRGRAYLALNAFTEAEADLETCIKRRGEAAAVFLDDVPTFRYFPPVYYYLGRAQQGLGSASAPQAYVQFLAIKAHSEPDPLVADARARAGQKTSAEGAK